MCVQSMWLLSTFPALVKWFCFIFFYNRGGYSKPQITDVLWVQLAMRYISLLIYNTSSNVCWEELDPRIYRDEHCSFFLPIYLLFSTVPVINHRLFRLYSLNTMLYTHCSDFIMRRMYPCLSSFIPDLCSACYISTKSSNKRDMCIYMTKQVKKFTWKVSGCPIKAPGLTITINF